MSKDTQLDWPNASVVPELAAGFEPKAVTV